MKTVLISLIAVVLTGCNTLPDRSEKPVTLKAEPFKDYQYAFDNSSETGRILSARKTVNPFLAWNNDTGISTIKKGHGDNGEYYGMHWNNGSWRRCSSDNRLELKTPSWNYHYVGKNWDNWSSLELKRFQSEFATKQKWNHSDIWDTAVVMNILDPRFSDVFAEEVNQGTKGCFNGVLLDWWHKNHPTQWRGRKVEIAMQKISKAIRQKMGDDFLILGNVNYETNKKVVSDINGVFLELYKKHGRPYTTQEIRKIESIVDFYNTHLRYPKVIALEAWRLTDPSVPRDHSDARDLEEIKKDRNSEINNRYARLFTAMSVVSADTGYILYPDNWFHDHHYYDVWRVDLGKPNSSMLQINEGVRAKRFEKGYVVYNRTNKNVEVEMEGLNVFVPAKDGVFLNQDGTPAAGL
jgi:nitrogen fixation protein